MAGQPQSRRRGLVALSTVAGLLVVGWLAGMPWLAGHWPRILAVGLFVVVFVAPRFLVPARSAASLAGVADPAARGRMEDERRKLQHDVRVGLLHPAAGGPARLGPARRADLRGADLGGADLRGADLRGPSLQHATLAGAHLEQSLRRGTQFQGADLSGAHLAGAWASTASSWPDGFDWRAAGAQLAESC